MLKIIKICNVFADMFQNMGGALFKLGEYVICNTRNNFSKNSCWVVDWGPVTLV